MKIKRFGGEWRGGITRSGIPRLIARWNGLA
jgi:hypothetical protein